MKSGREGHLPDFLIIGAQKSATTTLYADLACQDAVCMSSVKEPSVLVRFSDLEKAARYYARLFEHGQRETRYGEASTEYTQLPRFSGVAERARQLLGPELRLLYLVRNPVERAISHHYHAYSRGRAGADVNSAVRLDPMFVDNGRYAMQLEPWLQAFGRAAVLVIRFEDYVRDRAATVSRIGDFLSISLDPSRLELDRKFNESEGNRVAGYLRPFMTREIYKMWVRPMVPAGIRRRISGLLAPRAPERPAPPRPDTIDYLVERLQPDVDRLRTLLGGEAPAWNFDRTREKYAQPSGRPLAE
jgi:hypothetical protein